MNYRSFTAYIQTDVELTLTKSNLVHGKWEIGPEQTIGTGTSIFAFKAESRDNALEGVQGSATYTGTDHRTLVINFTVPMEGSNQIDTQGSTCDVHYPNPTGNDDATAYFTVTDQNQVEKS